MTILFLANNSLFPNAGGIERTTFNLISHLSKQNFNIIACFRSIPIKIDNVICVENTIYDGKDISDIIELYNVDIAVFPAGFWYVNQLKVYNPNIKCKIISCLHSPPKVGELIRVREICNSFFSLDLRKKIQKLPRALYSLMTHKNYVSQVRKGYSLGYENSDAVVLLSQGFFSDFVAYANILDQKKLYAIGNALSFKDTISLDEISNKSNKILFVGRFHNISKRIDLILKVWSLISKTRRSSWELDLVGNGVDFRKMKKKSISLKLENVNFFGAANSLEFFSASKIFLMTSKFEGWGMTLTESLQMGVVPIVMNSFASLHDIIIHGYNGFIVDDGDVLTMKNYCELLMNDSSLLKRMSENGVKSSSEFSMEMVGKKWVKLFNQL